MSSGLCNGSNEVERSSEEESGNLVGDLEVRERIFLGQRDFERERERGRGKSVISVS